jgi:hypothetical protein
MVDFTMQIRPRRYNHGERKTISNNDTYDKDAIKKQLQEEEMEVEESKNTK